jgi:hypothetical protein
MRLPNRENAFVPQPKLTEYLLSETHPVGRSKAQYLKNMGYDATYAGVLEEGLLQIAHDEAVTDLVTSEYGTKYVIDGSLRTPMGPAMQVRTVWFLQIGDSRPRFVTAYPL